MLNIKDLKVALDSDAGLVRAIDGLSLCIERGETFALVGDGLRIQRDERFHRRLRQHIHGLVQSCHHDHA